MNGWRLTAVLPLIAQLLTGTSFAEERTTAATSVMLPGRLTGVDSYGPVGYLRLCSPLSVGLNEWQVSFIARLLKPSDAQRELLSKLSAASSDARKEIALSCPGETIATGIIQLAAMEKRVAGLASALKTIRAPYETFYAALDKRQKDLLDALGPSRRGWRW